MTRSTRSSRRSAAAPARAVSIVGYWLHAGARSDAVPRLTVVINLNMTERTQTGIHFIPDAFCRGVPDCTTAMVATRDAVNEG